MGKLYRKDANIYKNGSQYFSKSEKWNEKGMQTNNVIRRENCFKQYCKSLPKSYKNAPKLLPATVLEASWEHLGHHRAFCSKTVSGGNSFLGGLWVAFGPLGLPKASAMLFGRTFLGAIFNQKSEKRHPKRHPKIDAEKTQKKFLKLCQNGNALRMLLRRR